VYASSGAIQWERGYTSLPDATRAYGRLLEEIVDGRLDPGQPVFREDLED
jgi:DNA-binding GntR family transcriptional regulator